MGKAYDRLQELRRAGDASEEQFHRFLEQCRQEAVPEVTLYVPSSRCEGWYEMFRIFVFSARPDIQTLVWCHVPGRGPMVFDADGTQGRSLKEWDPAADLFFDESLFDGGTNMSPFEPEKLPRRT